jgi:long-subunit acyl-CoA synthetase (AMP-forming)
MKSNLIKKIIAFFELYLENIFVIQRDKSYTYREIFGKSKALAEILNKAYESPIRILLVANNSVEWIITFFAILFSRHRLALFDIKSDIEDLLVIIPRSHIQLVITDNATVYNNSSILCNILWIDTFIQFSLEDGDLSETNTSILVISPRALNPIYIDHDKILDTMVLLGRNKIFDTSTIYLAQMGFAYNYLIGLLLPLTCGITIVIPNNEDTYGLRNELEEYEPEVVVITAFDFVLLYKTYIENVEDFKNNILKDLKLWFIRKYYLKSKIKKLFPKLQQLIILNSTLPQKIERTLNRLKIPYTTTFGRVEECGITSYERPEKYVKGSVGRLLSDELPSSSLFQEDNLQIDLSNDFNQHIFFDGRKEDTIHGKFGYIMTSDAENTFNHINTIQSCLLVSSNDKLILLVHLNQDVLDYLGLSYDRFVLTLEQYRIIINSKTSSSEYIDEIIPISGDFQRDSYKRIIRKYYENLSFPI